MVTTTFTATLPLKTDKDGVIRVSKTRVSLDTIVNAFLEGLTAEEISRHCSCSGCGLIFHR